MAKRLNIILFIVFSILVVSTVTIQSSFQHWSGQWDLDFWYIYNSSLMASGIGQEWADHPATTFLSLYSLFYKLYSLFDHSFIYNIHEILDSSNPNLVLQKLYFVTRIFDSINIILIIFFTFKILKVLFLKDIYAYFLIITLVFSLTFMNNLSILNPEDWAILFFLISFYYFLKFFSKNNINFMFFSGVFFSFSFFSKISILFLFIFTILLIPIFCEIYLIKSISSTQKFLEKKFRLLFSVYLAILFIYFIVQIFVFSKLSMFEKNAGLDVLIIFLINFFYMGFFFIISKFNIIKFRLYFSIFILFLSGFFMSPIIFIFIDFLNIAEFNPWVLFHLTNPFNEMFRFASLASKEISTLVSFGPLNFLLNIILSFFSNFLFDKFLFLGLCLIFIISTFKDINSKNMYHFLFKMIIFTSLVFNILIFNLRFFIEYLLYTHIIYIILLSICFRNISNRIKNIFCIISLGYVLIFLPIKNFSYFEKILLTRDSQLDDLCNRSSSELEIYSKKFNEDTYKKLCY